MPRCPTGLLSADSRHLRISTPRRVTQGLQYCCRQLQRLQHRHRLLQLLRLADFSSTSSIAGFSSSSRDSYIAKVYQFMGDFFKASSIAAGVSKVFQFVIGFFQLLQLSVSS